MPKCGICGGEAPRQPCITEDGQGDLGGQEVCWPGRPKRTSPNSNLKSGGPL